MIDAGGSADETVARLCNHERPALANDSLRLTEHRLDLSRIPFVAGELSRLRGCLELVEA